MIEFLQAHSLTLARAIVILSGLWLIAISIFMIYRPLQALAGLRKMASTNLINYTEITLRMIAGIAFVVTAREWNMSVFYSLFGWILVISAAVLYVIPRTWHQNYALFWAGKLTPFYVRAAAPGSLGVGILIVRAML